MALTKIKGAGINISATEKLYFDGGGTTYIQESADGVLDFYADNVKMLELLEGATDYVWIPVDATKFAIGAGKDLQIYHDGSHNYIDAVTGDQSIIFKGTDGSSDITALTLDMASAGAATFNDKIVATELDISGNMDIDGTSNLDAVDIDGAVQIDATVTVGADDQGYDVIFYGDTASSNMTWDTSTDNLVINDARLVIDQDDDDLAISIDSASTSADVVNISAGAVTTGIIIDVPDANALTTGSIINLYSGAADNNTRNLMKIHNDHSSADNTVGLFIQQDGADASIELGGNGSIKFPGTQGASSDANSLDDYEEGTWSPQVWNNYSGGTQLGAGTAVGRYVKIGQLVHIQGYWVCDGLNAASGDTYLRNLPFSSHSTANLYGAISIGYCANFSITAGTSVSSYVNHNGSDAIGLLQYDATTGISALQASEISADGAIIFGGTYITD